MRMPAARSSRSGLSLLEVIASLAIFLLALAGITQLMSTSTQAARRIQFQSQATLLCQSKLADFCAGVEPLDAGGGGDFEDDSGWKWSADSAAESTPGLYRVTVKVFKESSTGEVQFETSLSQFILSPATRGNLSATANQPADPSTNSSSSPILLCCVESSVHHVLMELLKNAFRSQIARYTELDLDRAPPVVVRLSQTPSAAAVTPMLVPTRTPIPAGAARVPNLQTITVLPKWLEGKP